MRAGLATAVVTAGLVAGAAAVADDHGDPRRGRELAERFCGLCHAWDPDDPYEGISSTPSFMWMAKKMDFYEERILSVTDRLPHIAQRLEVTAADLRDIAAYVASLAPRPRTVEAEGETETDATTEALRRYLEKLRRGGG